MINYAVVFICPKSQIKKQRFYELYFNPFETSGFTPKTF